MFTDHFQLSMNPFAENPPLHYLMADSRCSQALDRLQYFTQEGSIALVHASTGLGKSSLIRLFISRLSPTRFLPLYVNLTNLRSSSLLKVLLDALGEDVPARGKERLFLQILDRARHSEQTLVFLLDDAHLIPPDGLTDLRLLVSSILDDQPVIKILLAGQDHILQTLKRPSHLDLFHRICVRCHLRSLTQEETCLYIDSRLASAAASKNLFSIEAKALIHDYSGGVPRLINKIATHCLMLAASLDVQTLSDDLVHQAVVDFKLP